MSSPKLQCLSAGWIIPVAENPIRDGSIVSDLNSVLFVGPSREALARYPHAEKVRFPGKTVLPGLINAHCHLNHCYLKSLLPLTKRETFFDWIAKVISKDTGTSEEEIQKAALKGVQQLRENGTAAVGDITSDSFTISFLEDAGLAAVCFLEVVGFVPEEAETIYQENLSLPDNLKKPAKFPCYISPHSPYSVSRDLLARIARTRSRVSFHLAESEDEVEFLKKGHGKMEELLKSLGKWDPAWKPPGISPLRYFHEIGLLHEKAIAVHMVWVEEEDYPVLDKTKPNICLCPRSNDRLNNGLPPVYDYQKMGINLCLGTDGLGSNNDLSILNEMKYLKKCFPKLEDKVILRMGTLGGAIALGLEKKLGTIEPGKGNKFAIVDSGETGEGPYSFLKG